MPSYRDIDPGYLVVGHTSLTPEFHLVLTQEGLRKVLALLKNGESLDITIGQETTTIRAVK